MSVELNKDRFDYASASTRRQVRSGLDLGLVDEVTSDAIEFTALTRNSNGVVESATVKWRDGTEGTFTSDTINSTFDAIDAYTVTHPNSGKKVVQSAVTRDADGNVTSKPELTLEDI